MSTSSVASLFDSIRQIRTKSEQISSEKTYRAVQKRSTLARRNSSDTIHRDRNPTTESTTAMRPLLPLEPAADDAVVTLGIA